MLKYASFLISLMVFTGCLGSHGAGSGQGNDFGQRFVGNPEAEFPIVREALSPPLRKALEAEIRDWLFAAALDLHGAEVSRTGDPSWDGEMDSLTACGWVTVTEWEPDIVPPRPAPAGPLPFIATGWADEGFSSAQIIVRQQIQTLPQSDIEECQEYGIHIWGTPG